MKWWDIAILIANIVIMIVSGIGAYNSIRYFKKSKHITIYAQTNQAFNELGEMLKELPEALAAASMVKKGYNPENAVQNIGRQMSSHFNAIMSAIPSDYSAEFRQLQKTGTFELEKFISSLIDGKALVEENQRKTISRNSYDACQERLRAMQEFLKKKIDEEAEKLK